MPSLKSLGDHIDSYADLVTAAAPEKERVTEYFINLLKEKGIPAISMSSDAISVSGNSRSYYFVRHSSGAFMTIALREYGTDLLLKWDLWYKGSINIIVAAIAGVIGLVGLLFFAQGFPYAIVGLLIIVLAVAILVVAAARGKLFTNLDFLSSEDMIALKIATHSCLQVALDQIGIDHKLKELLTPALSSDKARII